MGKDFTDALLDPKGLKESAKYKIGFNAIQGLLLTILSIAGLNLAFGFDDPSDMLTVAYWTQFIMLFAEQLWADQIGFNIGLAIMLKKHPQYNDTVEQCHDIVEGVFDPAKNAWVMQPLKDDADLVNDATDELNIDRKIEWAKGKWLDKSKKLENKRNRIKGKRYFWLWKIWPFRWVMKIRIAARTRRIDKLNERIQDLNEAINDKKRHEDLKYRHIKGFDELDANSLLSGIDSLENGSQPRYHMVSGKRLINKRRTKKMFSKALFAFMGGMIAYQVGVGFKEGFGQIMYILFMVVSNLAGGWMFAADYLERVPLANESQRRNALYDIKNRVKVKKELAAEVKRKNDELKLIQAKLKAEIEKAEVEAYEENKRRDLEKATKIKAEQDKAKADREVTESKIRAEAERIAYEARVKAEAEELIKRQQQPIKLATP